MVRGLFPRAEQDIVLALVERSVVFLAPDSLGLSMETTCYLAPAYFEEADPFADFLVHEVAHICHNCERQRVGLPCTRRREWLLDIAFPNRETFADSCEAFARVVQRAPRPGDRPAVAAAFDGFGTFDGAVDADEVADIVREAARRRNGWKVILSRCAPVRGRRTAASVRSPDLAVPGSGANRSP